MAFTGKFESKSVSSDEDTSDEELTATYMLLHTKWEKVFLTMKNQQETIITFQKEKRGACPNHH